jgi:hypothetical protein
MGIDDQEWEMNELLLRDAIRHSATAAAKRSEDSRYRIEPRVQVYSHPFKQRLEPRVHLAGLRYPLPPSPANAHFAAIVRVATGECRLLGRDTSVIWLNNIVVEAPGNRSPVHR